MTAAFEFIAGLGVFLYAMRLLEQSLKMTAEFRLQQHLANQTGSPLQAILTGTVSTAILQSSSLVGLIVLALCGAGLLPLLNAIGVMIGANLGTTFTGWVVTFIGFKLDLTAFAFYFIGFSGLVHMFVKDMKLKRIADLFIAIGLLLLGLDLMKNAASGVSEFVDVESFKQHGSFYFFVLGIILSAIIQSSSAVMLITLSALNIQVIEIHHAAAIIIGADLGTTSTVLIGSIKGADIKRQLAMAHLLFNLVTDLLAFFLLLPFIQNILSLLNVTDPLYSLVTFHSLFNLMGILLFIPFLKQFSNFLSSRFQGEPDFHGHYIHKVPVEVPAIALQALKKEVEELIIRSLSANRQPLDGPTEARSELYEKLKAIEGEIFTFNIALQKKALSDQEIDMLTQLNQAVRLSIFSFKSLNDIQHDVQPLFRAHQFAPGVTLTQDIFDQLSDSLKTLEDILTDSGHRPDAVALKQLFENLRVDLKVMWLNNQKALYETEIDKTLSSVEISSLLNLNREIYNAGEHAITSVESLLASPDIVKPN